MAKDVEAKQNIPEKAESIDSDSQENSTVLLNETNVPNQAENNVLHEIRAVASDSTSYLQALHLQNFEGPRNEIYKYTPGPLQPNGVPISEVQQHLDSLILQSEEEDKIPTSELRQMDSIAKMAVVSHSLAAYVSTLEPKRLRRLATRIISDTSLWISRIFRFFDASAYFHDESRQGLVKLCRMLLYSKYPKYMTDGFEALYTKPPVIYISPSIRSGAGQYLCTELGLPQTSLTIMPSNTMFGSLHKMDISALEEAIQEDIKKSRTPLLVVASAGSHDLGHVDNLARLQEVCKAHDIWLHLEGHCLAGLCLLAVPNLPARLGDSMSLPLGTWLGVPSLPCITFYRPLELSLVHAAGLSSFNLFVRLNCLPLWASLQALGHEGVVNRIRSCFEITDQLLEKFEKCPKIKIISRERLRTKEGKAYSMTDVLSKSVSTTLLFDILVPVILIRYIGEESSTDDSKADASYKSAPYFDNLNSWLGQVLRQDWPNIKLDLQELSNFGICLRICLLESTNCTVNNFNKEGMEQFYKYFLLQLGIMTATTHKKQIFVELLKTCPNLQHVNIANWAGLGGVRYIPEPYVSRILELTDMDKEEVDKLNNDIVIRLKSSDSAFSLGEGDDGMQCIRFGMVSEELDVEELVRMVLAIGRELEESSKYLETMTEMVKQGIEEANKELEQENVEKLLQEGILRHVPLVGNFYNWWAPQAKESGIKGRSFNLTSGTVESTENIYKYHMQIQQGLNGPMVKTPAAQVIIKCDGHSRSSSRGGSSQQGLVTTMTNSPNVKTEGAQV